MTRIRATCPDCGNVEFGVHSIVVVGQRSTADLGSSFPGTTSTVYRFSCPECDRPVHRSAERDIIDLLLSVGVPIEEPMLATERLDPQVAALPAFTHADLDAFKAELTSSDWFEKLLSFAPVDESTDDSAS